MKISIITVCYNAARTIRDACASVLAQTQTQGTGVEEKGTGNGEQGTGVAIDLIREAAMKPIEMLTDEDKWHIVCAIEATKTVDLRQPSEERIRRFVRGYWDGDPKTIKEIVEWGGAVVPSRVENRYIGEIQTHRNSIRSILFHTRFRGPLKVLVLEHLTEILRDAVLYNRGADEGETFYNLAHRLSFDPGDGNGIREFVARLIVKETADGNRTWTIEFSNKKELTGVPTTGEAATVEVTRLKPPSTHTILKWIYGVNGGKGTGNGEQGVEIEHIVVDGGSTDGTVREIEDFAKEVGEGEGLGRRERGGEWNYSFRWVSEKDRGMYDAMNKGIRMATGDVIGILNADDVLDGENVLRRIVRLFDCSDCSIDGCYGDVRFVRELGGKTVRYCSGRWFRPWMFRFGVQTAHPSTFFRKECFAKWGGYSLDFGMYGDFELLCRFIWRNRARMKYLPLCTTEMRLGGASTDGWRTTLKINRSDLRALKANGCWSCLPLLYVRYLFKIWGFVRRGV